MKTADEYRKAFVFGRCDSHGIVPGPSLHCGKCLELAFAACIAEAKAETRAATLEECAKVTEDMGKGGPSYTASEVHVDIAAAIRQLAAPTHGTAKCKPADIDKSISMKESK